MTTQENIAVVREAMPDLEWISAPVHVKRLSRDFFWFSPVLQAQLADKKADIIAKPHTEAELIELVKQCVAKRIPMTVRGGGTGNYGQAVPLKGGVVIDMTALSGFDWVVPGLVKVKAGMKIVDLETQVRESGWELRFMPSTYKAASIGGLFTGGFGGVGSINYGPIFGHGTVQAIRILTVEDEPRIIELRDQEMLTYHHTYGTNGILLDMELALAPAMQWDEYLFDFATIESAYGFCRELVDCIGIEKRELSLYDSDIAKFFKEIPFALADGHTLVMTMVPPHCRQPLEQMVAKWEGKLAWMQTAQQAIDSGITVMEHCWNHTTLQALKHDKSVTNLQSNYVTDKVLEQVAGVKAELGDDVMTHLEFIRLPDNTLMITGLPLIRFGDEAGLNRMMAVHAKHDVLILNSHVYILEDGKHQGHLSDAILNSKRENDPYLLLNPGKIRAFN